MILTKIQSTRNCVVFKSYTWSILGPFYPFGKEQKNVYMHTYWQSIKIAERGGGGTCLKNREAITFSLNVFFGWGEGMRGNET